MITKRPNDAPRHHLFGGELFDAPGRNETWEYYVRYLGDSRWELIIESTDFLGVVELPPTKERMGTRKLVDWTLERDSELAESDFVHSEETEDVAEEGRVLGPHAERLREIAVEVNAAYCVKHLDAWVSGDWPPNPKVRKVVGVTRIGIWPRVFHKVFEVETSLGAAYMYPPTEDGFTKVVLKTECSNSMGHKVKLSRAVARQIVTFQDAFEQLGV